MSNRKSFFAGTFEAALAQARREFGEEAYLIGSGPTAPGQRHLGAVEVIVESDAPLRTQTASKAGGSHARQAEHASTMDLAAEVSQLREELVRLSGMLHHPAARKRVLEACPALAAPSNELAAAELPRGLELELLQAAAAVGPRDEAEARRVLRSEVASRLPGTSTRLTGDEPAIMAVVGPAGAGKTTILAKVAARYGLGRSRPALLVSTDTCRVGGADQLAAYGAILGIPCVLADTPAALAKYVEEHGRKSLVLVDTPGFAPADDAAAREWAGFLSTHPMVETHLVLAATHRTQDLRKLMRHWARFRPASLILTRLDETSHPGCALGVAMEAERPVSFLSYGQAVPEDLCSQEPEELAHLLVPAVGLMRAAA